MGFAVADPYVLTPVSATPGVAAALTPKIKGKARDGKDAGFCVSGALSAAKSDRKSAGGVGIERNELQLVPH
jgi:hypothetical protein